MLLREFNSIRLICYQRGAYNKSSCGVVNDTAKVSMYNQNDNQKKPYRSRYKLK